MVTSNPVIPTGEDAQLGKYRLLRRLAAGGMAEVFLATDDGNNLWAVKLILSHLADQPEFLGLFLDEARLASLLNHVNVARVRDMGMENGRLFLAMEYVRGQPLSALLTALKEKQVSLTPAQAAAILAQAAAGLNAAHDAKGRDGNPLELVHRDVSPQNLLLTEDGVVKVVDFGIAKAKNKLVVTQVNTTRGKPWYMSPEQMRGEKLDRRADIFSLGAVLFELMIGSRLFEGDVDQVMYKALNEPLPDLLKLRPDVPHEIADIVKRACARRPDDRFETAWEMEQELRAFAEAQGGAEDLGALVRSNFPPMPTTVEEVVGPAATPAKPPTARPTSTSAPRTARPQSLKPAPAGGPPSRIRRPGTGPFPPTVGEAPPVEKTPADPVVSEVAPSDGGGSSAATVPVPDMAAELVTSTETTGVDPPPAPPSDDAAKVPAQIPKRSTGAPDAGRKKLLIGGGIAAALLVVGSGVAGYVLTREPPPAPAPAPAAPVSLLGQPAAEAPKPAKSNPFAAVDDLPAPDSAPKPVEKPADVDRSAHVRLSCSDFCSVTKDGEPWASAGPGDVADYKVAPGRHTYAAIVGDEARPHTSRTLKLAALETGALHFGKTDGKWRAGAGVAYSYQADGIEAMRKGEWSAAARDFREALSLDCFVPGLHRDLGIALSHGEEKAEARFQLETYLLTMKPEKKGEPKDAAEIRALIRKLEGR